MLSTYQRRILRHIRDEAYEPRRIRALAEELGVPREEHAAFREAVSDLAKDQQVVLGADDTVALPPLGREVTGTFKLHERGFGFLIPDTPNTHGDLFVRPQDTGGALSGDRVRAKVIHGRGRRGVHGQVSEIIQRRATSFVGTLDQQGKMWVVHPDGTSFTDPIVTRDPGAKNAKAGDKVVVELTVFPERNQTAEGVITEVLGESGKPDVETMGIIRAFGLHEKFEEEVIEEAREAAHDYNDHADEYTEGRLDLRETFTLTIDPPDARDFDDAISLERTDKGWRLGVHIADVATFVRPGAELDTAGYDRANSVYLPRLVLPMLPEILSNGICSLQPGVPRLAKSVFIDYDAGAKVTGTTFANSVIESNYRLTYLEAQALIDGDRKQADRQSVERQDYTEELEAAVRDMNELAGAIRKRRDKAGMITLDLPEVELEFDDQGHVIDAHPEDDAFTHKIIEAFMVEANEAVARAFADLNVPVLRRIHPDPGQQDTDELRQFARVAGYNIPANPSRKELQGLLEATRGKPAAKAVHLAVLKTLTKAEYAPQMIGHFALASDHYLHFTSPIRRYPDLTAHRALEALLDAAGNETRLPRGNKARKQLARQLEDDPRCPGEDKLAEIGRHCSAKERNAEAAERELRDYLVLQLMHEKHLGDDFPGTVTGVTSFGIFVQIDKYLVEGLIRTGELPGAPAERWKLNEHTGSLAAQRSGRSITIGDTFTVRVVAVDLAKRQMNLQIVEKGSDKRKGTPRKGKPRREEQPKPRKPRKGRQGGPKNKSGRKPTRGKGRKR